MANSGGEPSIPGADSLQSQLSVSTNQGLNLSWTDFLLAYKDLKWGGNYRSLVGNSVQQ